ncbi:MAG TPA: glycoside hydrolase family 15 protein [Mycobacteriales bacterium]|nr:glycoside hydrolase family 15 protein [Mycobacteriales bacterium]
MSRTDPLGSIAELALLGDCHSSALVDRQGRIVWATFPRFDSPAVFCRLLDESRGGSFDVTPRHVRSIDRRYLDDTNVLVTAFEGSEGRVEVTDCMPVRRGDGAPYAALLRRIACVTGRATVDIRIAPRFEYGRFVPRFTLLTEHAAEVVGGADALWVSATRPLGVDAEAVVGSWTLEAGEEAYVEASWTPSHTEWGTADLPDGPAMAGRLEDTVGFWREWMAGCRYDGDHSAAVHRSALALKALIYAPSGAVVAAPTTSLPELPGGERNWDYRYTWIRDSTLTLASLFILGFREEAAAFKRWLERTGAGRPRDLQIMYGVCGERSLPEVELDYLDGHRASRPVRIGNGAVKQLQLDCYGQLVEAAYLFGKADGVLTESNWAFLAGLADIVCDRWRVPDQGIWEIRDDPRHFLHSKLNCWVALDRVLRIAGARDLPGDLDRWRTERDALRDYLLEEGAVGGYFGQAVGYPVADAAVLLFPALGFLASDHPLVARTIEVVRRDLGEDGLLRRYHAPDGLEGGEGVFLLCSFWLLDCLTHAGRLAEAEDLLERLLALANDVGLYAEEYDPSTGELLGNFPQAFTHMALITSCAHLSAARRGLLPTDGEPHDYTELALDRLLAGTGTGGAETPVS